MKSPIIMLLLCLTCFSMNAQKKKGLDKILKQRENRHYSFLDTLSKNSNELFLKFGFFISASTPIDSHIQFIGSKAGLGFILGGMVKKHSFDLSLGFEGDNTKEPFAVLHEDSLRQTQDFTPANIQLDYTYQIFKRNHNIIAALSSISFDRATVIHNSKNRTSGYSINGIGYSIGGSYKYIFQNKLFIEPQIRVKANNYFTKKSETNISGNNLQVRIIVGSFFPAQP